MTLHHSSNGSAMVAQAVPHHLTTPWLVERHYAHRLPAISHSFGLFIDGVMEGVCTFGPPPRMLNNSYGVFGGKAEMDCFELNRLVIGDSPPVNALSWFVGRSLQLMPRPSVIVSYADPNHGHHGYIYQATNWLYTGQTNKRNKYVNAHTGKDFHARSVVSTLGSEAAASLPDWIDVSEQDGKHRYLYLLGSSKQRKRMRRDLVYDVLPYPKGDNLQYETPGVARQAMLDLQ